MSRTHESWLAIHCNLIFVSFFFDFQMVFHFGLFRFNLERGETVFFFFWFFFSKKKCKKMKLTTLLDCLEMKSFYLVWSRLNCWLYPFRRKIRTLKFFSCGFPVDCVLSHQLYFIFRQFNNSIIRFGQFIFLIS